MAGSGFPGKKGWDGGINSEKWAGKWDLRSLLWTLLSRMARVVRVAKVVKMARVVRVASAARVAKVGWVMSVARERVMRLATESMVKLSRVVRVVNVV